MTTETPVIEKKKTTKVPKAPGKYKVVVCNDDVTPVEFVVSLLINVFKHGEQNAINITMQIHNQGNAVAGIYPYEIAEQKLFDCTMIARDNGYPLVIKVEAE